MLPQSLLVLTASLLVPLISAGPPSCQPSNSGADLLNFTSTSTSFCQKLANESFILDTMMYGVQKSIIAFQFTPQNTTNATEVTCDLDSCLNSVSALTRLCEKDSHTIYGSGNTYLGCGTFNFTIAEMTTATPTPAATASKTGKPEVGSTALGTSGAGIVKGSGYVFLGVALVFGLFL